MGFIGKWAEKRRTSELERISKEIEALKNEGPSYSAPKEVTGRSYTKKDVNIGLLILVGLAIIGMIGLSLFYKGKFDDLTEKYDTKLAEVEDLNKKYQETTLTLNETSEQLSFKEQVEKDLSDQYKTMQDKNKDLEGEKTDLLQQVEDLNDKVKDKEDEITAKNKIIQDIQDCIEDNNVTDKEDCI